MSEYDPAAIVTGADGTTATVGASGLHVDVRSSALPTGAATQTTLASVLSELQAVLAKLDVALSTRAATTDVEAVRDRLPSALVGGRLSVDVGTSALPSGAATEATLGVRHNGFASLIKFEAEPGEELRAEDDVAGNRFHGRAVDGTATSASSWEIVKFERTVSGDIERVRFFTAVKWDDRGTL